jgi:hypothetical protein
MNNEPVAWVDGLCLALIHKCKSEWVKVYREKKNDEYIPLYDHQPAKTLTDDEIMSVIEKVSFASGYLNGNLIRFARAILKKAGKK